LPQSNPRARLSCSTGDTYCAGTSSMTSSTATHLPSSLLISRKVGASSVAPCQREENTVAGKGISSLHAPQAHCPCPSGERSLSQREACFCSCLVWTSQQYDTSMRAR